MGGSQFKACIGKKIAIKALFQKKSTWAVLVTRGMGSGVGGSWSKTSPRRKLKTLSLKKNKSKKIQKRGRGNGSNVDQLPSKWEAC
jgi:hypothetical protein